MTERLLAKSYRLADYPNAPPDYALLTQHSRDVASACDALAESVGRVALRNAGLEADAFERFKLALKANGWMQDLGKASSHFQEMVRGASEIRQLVRHEAISGMLMLLEEQPFRTWLSSSLPEEVLLFAVWGAMGHHRKFDKYTKPEQGILPLTVHVAHDDFSTILREMRIDLQLKDEPPLFKRNLVVALTQREDGDLAARDVIRDLQRDFEGLEAAYADDGNRRLLALVKAFGIAADVAASAVAARGQSARSYSLREYVAGNLGIGLAPDALSQLISRWAWNRSSCDSSANDETSLPPGFEPREFQRAVAESASRLTLAQAGCGSGKSLAAYMWAHSWCQRFLQEGRLNFRLFFCLPTTGTTTEHFKDYALESGIDPAFKSLTHSRSSVDLRAIAETAPQEDAKESERDPAAQAQATLSAERDKIESLALWSTPLVVTTADTVLGLMSNARRAIYSLPAIMSGVIVFDEIHAFDEQMFGHLLVFLKNFPQLPVLLMTASLPERRLRALQSVRPDLNPIPGPQEFEDLERYVVKIITSQAEVWRSVEDCVAAGGKVLWVRNRVEWANDTYRECRARFPEATVNVYHSRLRYKDRAVRHRRVIDGFKVDDNEGTKRAAILVATQVAEMSLDLSADLLVTDIAPTPALIQRMGRLNRRALPSDPPDKRPPKLALICALQPREPNVEKPYKPEELDAASRWLEALGSLERPLSQRDLSEAFAQLDDAQEFDFAAAEKAALFFSGLWETRPGLTRGEGYTISVILEEDLLNCDERNSKGEPTRDWLRRYEVAIPIKEEVLKWERTVGGLRVAPRGAVSYDYDEQTQEGTGARWRSRK
ncbi:MAG TPA: CRISPR-associated helicase Cas3' [Pyrinomonadaceae bacterium]|nr:CRISPR-associated helicase Cas3' [Pyrinomonadaceae bacterium]